MSILSKKEMIEDEFQSNLLDYIRKEWGDVLGDHVKLLAEEDGLDKIAALIRSGELRTSEV